MRPPSEVAVTLLGYTGFPPTLIYFLICWLAMVSVCEPGRKVSGGRFPKTVGATPS